jgi:hypothetical protein
VAGAAKNSDRAKIKETERRIAVFKAYSSFRVWYAILPSSIFLLLEHDKVLTIRRQANHEPELIGLVLLGVVGNLPKRGLLRVEWVLERR